MEKETKITYFGCSFTALETNESGYEFINYRHIVDKDLNVKSKNYSRVGKSNQHIIDDIYNVVNYTKEENEYKHIFVIQTTFNDRLGLPCDIANGFVSMCKRENPDNLTDEIQINFYNDWLKYFYSRTNSLKEFKKQIELISCYLDMNHISYIFVGIDETLDFITETEFFGRYKFLKFDNTFSYYNYAKQKKLRIIDVSNFNITDEAADYHFNNDGHRILAEKIIQTIKTI
jgi:hypothetical protein